ncbi:S1 domain-containing RNA-binding protein [Alkaliphilus peptidifermentans]|uniref:S1 RNA binding domain protein n=1 Tax=Alkaliphilus peptidifermentans DSM 18978 TaxID=1120976 RepID=A0A1G5AJJ1_9FIRM|nr:S1 domain-containing RNA-binding protein [Alkaliphilus peptidifermentans]SCX78044.1 S1 RNA binding domain protein [Alkaliphilus peptidifermentans DSM 18978]
MPLEVGNVVEGTVSGITNFGAFIDLGEGKTGLVHISEVANDYVKNINEYLKADQKVKVKVLAIEKDGKISLSIKQAIPPKKRVIKPVEYDWSRNEETGVSFEDKLNRFLKDSDEKIQSIKSKSKSNRKSNGHAKRAFKE